MQEDPSYNESNNQNIVASILQTLPRESSLTKIEYEGPNIALYSDNPVYLLKNSQVISNMVSIIKKRIVIRTDESIRKPQNKVLDYLINNISNDVKIDHAFFDHALGEVDLYVRNPFLLISLIEGPGSFDLVEKTGWKFRFRKTPANMDALDTIYKILSKTSNERIRFYKEVGERIFRSRLDELAEASLITLGGFAEIGRSAILLSTQESKILLDCGLNLCAKEPSEIYPRLDITGIEMNELDAVVLSHAHLDHSGFLPALFKYGYSGPVYCSEPTLPLMCLLHREYIRKAGDRAIYSLQDTEKMVAHTIPLNLGIVTDISPDVKLTLANSGHILGSALIHLHIGNGDHNLVYTGDIKTGNSVLLGKPTSNFPRVETIVIESTYGNKEDVFPDYYVAVQHLIDSLNTTISNKGTVLIPVPAIGLAQELALIIDSYMNSGKITETEILIERIIFEATSIYEAYPEYLLDEVKNRVLQGEKTPFESKHFITVELQVLDYGPAIILSPSSSLSEGPSLYYLKQISQRPESKLILTSYQIPGSPARFIQEGGRHISINDQDIQINCDVERIEGLTVHSDYSQLIGYISKLRPKARRVLVNHGERTKVQNLATSINRILKIQTQHPSVQEAIKLI